MMGRIKMGKKKNKKSCRSYDIVNEGSFFKEMYKPLTQVLLFFIIKPFNQSLSLIIL